MTTDDAKLSAKDYAKTVYQLSSKVNSPDDEAFYAIEEMGEVMSGMSDLRRARVTKEYVAREITQAIMQLEKYAYSEGILDQVWNQYEHELYVLKKKIEEKHGTRT